MSANDARAARDTSADTAAIRALLDRLTDAWARGDDGHWLVAAFQNTKHQRLLEAVTFRFQPNSKPLAGR